MPLTHLSALTAGALEPTLRVASGLASFLGSAFGGLAGLATDGGGLGESHACDGGGEEDGGERDAIHRGPFGGVNDPQSIGERDERAFAGV